MPEEHTEILGWRRIDLGGVMQERTYKGERGDLHAAAWGDASAYHFINGGYDSRCGWCWLNAPHTEDAHTASIGAHS